MCYRREGGNWIRGAESVQGDEVREVLKKGRQDPADTAGGDGELREVGEPGEVWEERVGSVGWAGRDGAKVHAGSVARVGMKEASLSVNSEPMWADLNCDGVQFNEVGQAAQREIEATRKRAGRTRIRQVSNMVNWRSRYWKGLGVQHTERRLSDPGRDR